jgi:hypothetical protein
MVDDETGNHEKDVDAAKAEIGKTAEKLVTQQASLGLMGMADDDEQDSQRPQILQLDDLAPVRFRGCKH